MAGSVHVLLGTKAQYIKTAPVVHELLRLGVPTRLVDLGQHGKITKELRSELDLPEPEITIGGDHDVESIPQALRWAGRVSQHLVRSGQGLFVGGGICLVHGDTPSTLLAAMLARRHRVPVAHLEAGLRSASLLEPFPEEAIRRLVTRLSSILYAPDRESEDRLRRLRVRGVVVQTNGNTSLDALKRSLRGSAPEPEGPAVFTMHRVENLHRRDRVDGFVDLLVRAAQRNPVVFVVHGPTWAVIEPHQRTLIEAGVQLVDLLSHADFSQMLCRARFVVTDGGSIQEECAYLGVPTLLWRAYTERSDGLGRNVILSSYDPQIAADFLGGHQRLRGAVGRSDGHSPSAMVAEDLRSRLVSSGLSF